MDGTDPVLNSRSSFQLGANVTLKNFKWAFPAIAAILVGGASLKKANIWHVIIGVVLYQAILTIAPVVSAQLIDDGSSLSEIARVIICNGVILYALTKIDGRKI